MQSGSTCPVRSGDDGNWGCRRWIVATLSHHNTNNNGGSMDSNLSGLSFMMMLMVLLLVELTEEYTEE